MILVLSGAAFGFCSWCDCLGIFRDGIRWIWERTGRIIEDRQREIRKRREEKRGEQSTAEQSRKEKKVEEKRTEEQRREGEKNNTWHVIAGEF